MAYAPPELSEPAITKIRLEAAIENQLLIDSLKRV